MNNPPTPPIRIVLLVLVVVAFIASLVLLTGRVQMESNNKSVEMVMDYTDLVEISRSEFIWPDELLGKMKEAGITSIAFTEMNLNQLQEQGKLQWMSGANLVTLIRMSSPGAAPELIYINPGSLYVFDYSPEMGATLRQNLALLIGSDAGKETKITLDDNRTITLMQIPGNPQELPTAGLGFDRELIRQVHEKGFHIVLRPENRPRLDAKGVDSYLQAMAAIPGVSGIIFGGLNEVIGYPQYLDAAVDGFKKYSLTFGDIEVPNVQARQKGAQYLSLKIPDRTVRVMSLPPLYLAKLTPPDAADKFRLAVRERNIRLLYLRPFASGYEGKNVIDTNLAYISSISTELKKYGFVFGAASRFPLASPHPAPVILISLGAGAICLLLLELVYKDKKNLITIVVLAGALLLSIGLIVLGKLHLVQKIVGLILALAFPVYAFASRFEALRMEKKGFWSVLGHALSNFTQVSLITLMGGLMIAGLFASTTYMLAIDQFRGIKLVMIVPPLVTIILFYLQGKKNGESLPAMLKQPLYIWQVIILGIIGAIGAIYIIRTGNAGEAISSPQEQAIRTLLEESLWVRPRFKDFMLGHPGMILAFALAALNMFKGLGLFVLAGSIGQADIVDTFAHIHTPVFISLVRVLLGAGLGIVFGSLFFACIQVLKKYYQLYTARKQKAETVTGSSESLENVS